MTLQYASDLHLELLENAEFVASGALEIAGDILLLAGDICHLDQNNDEFERFLDKISSHYQEVFIVPGEHEFQSEGNRRLLGHCWRFMLRENVGVYYNQLIHLDNLDLMMPDTALDILPQWISHSTAKHRVVLTHECPNSQTLTSFQGQIDYWIHGHTHCEPSYCTAFRKHQMPWLSPC